MLEHIKKGREKKSLGNGQDPTGKKDYIGDRKDFNTGDVFQAASIGDHVKHDTQANKHRDEFVLLDHYATSSRISTGNGNSFD